MTHFKFDPTKNQNDNIESFLNYIETINCTWGSIIRNNIEDMTNFTDLTPSQKSNLRTSISDAVLKILKQKEGEENNY